MRSEDQARLATCHTITLQARIVPVNGATRSIKAAKLPCLEIFMLGFKVFHVAIGIREAIIERRYKSLTVRGLLKSSLIRREAIV